MPNPVGGGYQPDTKTPSSRRADFDLLRRIARLEREGGGGGGTGTPGPPGPPGPPGIEWESEWNPTTDYEYSDVVHYEGSSYFASEPIPTSAAVANDYIEVCFDADRLGLANGAAVASWQSSGLRTNVTVTCSEAVKPVYVADAFSGNGGVRLNVSGFSGGFTPNGTAEFSILAVVQLKSGGSYPMLVVYPASGFEFRCEGASRVPTLSWATSVSMGTALTIDQPALLTLQYVQATQTVSMWLNGAPQVTAAPITGGPIAPSATMTVGGRWENAYNWTGDIGFLGIHNSPITVANRQLMEGTLAWRFGLQGSLPVGHPYKDSVPGSQPPPFDDRWEMFAQGGTSGGGAGAGYVHNQGTPASTWVINHNLGFYPNVVVEDSAGTTVEGETAFNNSNQLTLVFSAAFSGVAYLS